MTTKKSDNHGLEQAMALLIQTQAMFVSQITETNKRFDETNRETSRRFARIEEDLEQIKAILLRHEKTLQALPEAIRAKIGVNPNP